ncbi:1,4-beta-xylanase [Chitinophaga horti]|uniref:1,4-beta-xylanase n=1 Tax=Chitinophaga horti TaxID=2920382 RepID=A0ABY6J323_9BACT|nr:glycoside hydrolase family 2 TIM barrel-domain containing protein [Chitinophaga horti]UYQ94047.1 1,4-beta-xylanase [Chitinophaga horti]
MKKFSTIFLACSLFAATTAMSQKKERAVWSKEKANTWYAKLPWLAGADYLPANAINQLEMWQAESFDSAQIDKELAWAESIGMNVMRVYLHHLAWQVDPAGFKKRVATYLDIAGKHGIKTVFVLFDDCWNNTYKAGKQPAPKPGIHNSGWVQDPGMLAFMDLNYVAGLEKYVKDVLQSFRNDQRILLWDLYNEPGNSGLGNHSMPLLKQTFSWGRQIDPSQPLSAGVWRLDLKELNEFQLQNSDVITYHNYHTPDVHQRWIDSFLVQTGKPLICTEYMARTRGSRFDNVMPMLKKQKIAAINWGFVAGKSNTIYAWDTPMPDGAEPKVWFHDIFRQDGTPFDQKEVDLIKQLTGKK